MTQQYDLDDRLRQSARKLREWNWLAAISTRRAEAVVILRDEARFLIQLGLQHPTEARRIGRLIVAYRRLIEALDRMTQPEGADVA
ncbi:MAG: hypothetical protein P0Y65_05545 [Candidatus Devosia phytovorans]|uniref:Uncharacterized protein n=1 Tax=Candidatus Devosia phytovorans TaxID=3121372 RepID=A0AAJ5VY88_9HYPH|nr:hypothetical protein [Devosia sp.]WEK05718.1 MAG: hypothetical protein P0Y65_05545 [Devosia sp.]